jgi:hypothetical protein
MTLSPQEAIPFGIDVDESGSVLDYRRPSVWVASPDIAAAGGRIVTTIVRVCRHPRAQMHDGRTLVDPLALYFENDVVKPLIMEAHVNLARLALALGDKVAKWKGARVVLFNEPTSLYGTRCLGVRIRAARDGE